MSLWPSSGGTGCCCHVPKEHPRSSNDSPSPPLLCSWPALDPPREECGGGQGPHCTWEMQHSPVQLCLLFAGCFLSSCNAVVPGQPHGKWELPLAGSVLSWGQSGLRELCSHGHSRHGECAVTVGTCVTLSLCQERGAPSRLCRG